MDTLLLLVQPRIVRLDEYVALCRKADLGLELIECSYPGFLDDLDSYVDEILRKVPSDMVRAVHGPFLDIVLHSPDPAVRAVSERRALAGLDAAERLGADFLLLHSNHVPLIQEHGYDLKWLQRTGDFLTSVDQRLRRGKLTVVIENMWDRNPSLLVQLVKDVGSPHVALCLDTGHHLVHGSGDFRSWWQQAGAWTKYVQYGDNTGAADDDLALGAGVLDWSAVDECMRAGQDPVVMAGVGFDDGSKLRQSLDFLALRGVYPFAPREQGQPVDRPWLVAG